MSPGRALGMGHVNTTDEMLPGRAVEPTPGRLTNK